MSFAVFGLNYQIKNMILWGFSLGSGPSVELASYYQNLGGIILQSPIASIFMVIDKIYDSDYPYKAHDIYCNINKIENIKSKIFIFHGKEDNVIESNHSEVLFEKYIKYNSESNKIWLSLIEGAGHNDLQFLFKDSHNSLCLKIKSFIESIKTNNALNNQFNNKDERGDFLHKENNSLAITYSKLKVIGYFEKKIDTDIEFCENCFRIDFYDFKNQNIIKNYF